MELRENDLPGTLHWPTDKAHLKILSADTIGDTAYSRSWVLKVIFAMGKCHLERRSCVDVEQNLCYLWDMTANKDVATFMVDHFFLSFAQRILTTSNDARLKEIVTGILGNICCFRELLSTVGNDVILIRATLNQLLDHDTQTIIQVVRILQTAMWKPEYSMHKVQFAEDADARVPWMDQFHQCRFLGEALCFILTSSKNEQLLTDVVNLVNSMMYVELDKSFSFRKVFNMKSLVASLVEALLQLISEQSEDESHSRTQVKTVEKWLEILLKIMAVALPNVRHVLTDSKSIVDLLTRILKPYKIADNLRMALVDKSVIVDCIHQCIELVEWFQKNGFEVDSEPVAVILEFMYQLDNLLSTEFNDVEVSVSVQELQNFLQNYWTTLRTPGRLNIPELLELLPAEVKDYLTTNLDENNSVDQNLPQ
ncbi:protein saal1-like [Diachasmimorpha longicaudata]|uniref:protein saal1-like n=1 Tax=Diachasmimorpha longicaudata TaxID=58733 RepID=UPI0030B8DFEE